MTSEVVDIKSTNSRIGRVIDALAAARGIHTRKELAELVGIDEDTLGRRMNGKGKHGWQAAELLAIATVLDVPITVLFESDPDDWFRRPATAADGLPVTVSDTPAPLRASASPKRRNSVYTSVATGTVAA